MVSSDIPSLTHFEEVPDDGSLPPFLLQKRRAEVKADNSTRHSLKPVVMQVVDGKISARKTQLEQARIVANAKASTPSTKQSSKKRSFNAMQNVALPDHIAKQLQGPVSERASFSTT